MATEIKQQSVILNYFEQIWHQQKYDQLTQYVNPDATFTTPMREFRGIEAVKNYLIQFHQAMDGV